MRRIMPILCLLAIARGQVVRSKPATEQDNAATLYALAVAELERGIRSGLIAPHSRPKVQVANGAMIRVLLQGTGEPEAPEEDDSVRNSVMARSLFQQASARPVCRFGKEFAVGSTGDKRLQRLVDLITLHARANLKEKPVATCDDACTLLRYVRHRRNGLGTDAAVALRRVESQALQMLHDGLVALRRDRNWAAHAARYAIELDAHAKAATGIEAYTAMFCREIPELIALHQPRLRDMHMNVAGGYDEIAMRRYLDQLTAKIFAKPESGKVTFGQWLRLVDERTKTMLVAPADDASIKDKATYGMAQLVFLGRTSASKNIREAAELTEKCRDALRARGSKR